MNILDRISSYFSVKSNLGDYGDFASKADAIIDNSQDTSLLSIGVVHSCVKVISEALASMPLQVLKDDGTGAFLNDPNHRLRSMLNKRPNYQQLPFEFMEEIVTSILIKGKSFTQLIRNYNGEVIQMVNLDPGRMSVGIDKNGKNIYMYKTKPGKDVALGDEDVMFIKGFLGVSPLELSRRTFEAAVQQEEYGTNGLRNATAPSGIITRDKKWAKEGARERFIESWKKAYAGAKNAGKTVLLEDGMQFKQLTAVPAKDMQFIEAKKLTKTEICGIFRVAPSFIGEEQSGKYDSVEMKARSFIKFTLMPHITRIEQAMNNCLLDGNNSNKIEFYLDGLLRADSKTRMETNVLGVSNSIITINEARAIENRPPVEGGDQILVPLNLGIGFNREDNSKNE